MKSVYLKSNIYLIDKKSVEGDPLNYKNIMNKAGKLIAEFIIENIKNIFNQKFIVLAGPGNNGGDAMIAHYYLLKYNINSSLILFDKSQTSNWFFKKYVKDLSSFKYYREIDKFNSNNYYLDAIFGIGLNKKLNKKYLDVINSFRDFKNIISVDIPSGIYCDTGKNAGSFINSFLTLSIGNYKIGHYFNDGLEASGKVINLDIGLKKFEKNIKTDYYLLEKNDIIDFLPKFLKNTNKYTKGKLIVIAGSLGYTGASILSVNAAIKTGAGVVKILIPKSLNNIIESLSIEGISVPIDDDNNGYFKENNTNDIILNIKNSDAILFGPGLRNDKSLVNWKIKVLLSINKKLIIDASGFEPLILKKIKVNDLPKFTILTPHYYEFSKIFGFDLDYVKNNILESVKKIIPLLKNRVLILKGPTTIIVTSEAKIYFIDIGSELLATAGTGDVLSGIIASLLAQGLSIDNSALLGTYLHAKSSDFYKTSISSNGLIASDIIGIIPNTVEKIAYEN